MATQLIKCTSEREWDEFILNSPHGSVFSLSSFLNAFDTPHDKLFFELDGEIVASALVLGPDQPDFRMQKIPYLYQGIALAPMRGHRHSIVGQALRIISALSLALTNRYKCFGLCLHHSLTDLRGFQWLNYHTPDLGKLDFQLQYTGLINLAGYSSFEEYVKTIRSSRRQDEKKSKKFNFTIEESKELAEFMTLYQLTFSRQDIEISHADLTRTRRLLDVALTENFGKLMVCRNDQGVACSAIVTMHDAKCTYYMFGATNPEFRSSGANTALLLDSIRDSYASNRLLFDMLGVNSPQRGDFKTSFNAEPVPVYALSFPA